MSHELTDTRVTAYIFAELSSQETAEFERELANSRELQAELAAIRETLGALESEFESRSAGVGDSQREAIEEAIRARSSNHKINLDHSTYETPKRRLMVVAVMAASLMIVVGLAYPYLQIQTRTPVSMHDPAPSPEIETSTEVDEQIVAVVESFSGRIEDKYREEAEAPSKQVAQLNASDPTAITMSGTSELGKQLKAAGGLNESSGASAPARPTIGERRFDAGMEFGSRPSQTIARDALMGDDADNFGDVADLEIEDAIGGIELPADLDGDGLFGESTTDSKRKKEPRQSRRNRALGMEMKGMMDMDMEMEDMMGMEESQSMMDADGLSLLSSGARNSTASGGMGMEDMTSGIDVELESMMGGVGMDMEMDSMMGGGGMGMGMGGMMRMELAQGDKFQPIEDNPFMNVHDVPLSTFSIDVDTASYAKVRSLLNQNSLPRPDAVRIEELLNYFNYNYAPPEDDHPFATSMEIATCPWNPKHRLARIGIKGKVIQADRPSSNLVFLLDVSGSMDEPNKLPLVVKGMKMLTDQLTENDKVAIVVYAGAAGMILDSTRGDKKQQIVAALDRLKAGGSTNGGQGIMLAYQLARDNFIVGGTNRVILCSDGDFNVGVTGTDQLVSIAQENAKSNIFLSVLGFGIGNHNDAMMEQISNKGNGNYAFIDSRSEAKKVLVEELGGTLVTIAKDVKVQIEFNPQEVAAYRLIGYENRMLEAEDFNDDNKDAGEIGAGHTVTALYEIVPTSADRSGLPAVDNLRYQKQIKLSDEAASGEMLVLKLRYKQPHGNTSTLITFPVSDAGKKFSETDRDFQFAASVAGFGMLLRNSPHKGNATFAGVARIAREGAKGDETGYRIEFLELVTKAQQLRNE